ncbi:hypothetical protein BDN72DRAFT_335757 [Pluteus cervinus]|uniref:Uncharacterized protein n=1 Tax=Pluteus cervinus TaxID=181527 RepID=A0ACD3B3D9_9AGAR|nr:hypothetical protein BDN72DRAFT_335757 [Pluteus cervinus]
MSKSEFQAKFPGQASESDIPPSPTAENPGQVYPKWDPQPAQQLPRKSSEGLTIGATAGEPTSSTTNITDPTRNPSANSDSLILVANPFLIHQALEKVDTALEEIVSILHAESNGSMHVESINGPTVKDDSGTHPAVHEWLQKIRGWRDEIGEMRCRTGKTGTSTIARDFKESYGDTTDQPTIGSTGGGERLIRQEGGMFVD